MKAKRDRTIAGIQTFHNKFKKILNRVERITDPGSWSDKDIEDLEKLEEGTSSSEEESSSSSGSSIVDINNPKHTSSDSEVQP